MILADVGDQRADLDPAVARYFAHALAAGSEQAHGTQLEMRGRIKVGAWLPFRARWEGDGHSLDWRATVGLGPLALLRVRDYFAAGTGSMDIRLFGRLRVVHSEDQDTARSAAGRAAAEAALWSPASLLPERGVVWRTEADDHIVASCEVPPERPEIHIRIDDRGGVRNSWLSRWTSGDVDEPGYVPFGVDVRAERTFGSMTIASRVAAGWWYGTPRYKPFFEAEISAASPLG